MEANASKLICSLQKRWVLMAILADLLLALAVTIAVQALLQKFIPAYTMQAGAIVFAITFIISALLHRFWKLQAADIARYLNSRLPQLQESAQLLLKPASTLNQLEKLQAGRVEQAIELSRLPPYHNKKIFRSLAFFLLSLLLAIGLRVLPGMGPMFRSGNAAQPGRLPGHVGIEKKVAGIYSVTIKITPPPYTRLRTLEQPSFTIRAAEGSGAAWQIRTDKPVEQLSLVFNDKETIALHTDDAGKKSWSASKTLVQSGYYQVKIQDRLSEMYLVDLAKDQPPAVRILAPKQYTTIDYGQPQLVPLRAQATDDYGISDAYITATIASGSGEAVKFKEQRLPFPRFTAGSREAGLQKTLDLPSLGMKPGDELYYYVSAHDNHRQENRSDIYIITLPDTAQLMEIEGITNGINPKQDYFRSQRQIIIETEQLLKGKDTLSIQHFNAKSNDLGIDQKLLRMRYGKFLGEESENEVSGHQGQEETRDETVFGDATRLIDEITHKHDNAEDATFFEPKLKAQLRETLSEMWKAELQLRLYKPQQALPFEYKALRLLKDLQQQSRSYVAKAAYKTAPLRSEKRLTGDITKIAQPVSRQAVVLQQEPEQTLLKTAGLLEELKIHALLPASSQKILQAGEEYLGRMAVEKPAVYLISFEAMKRVLAALDHPAAIQPADLLLAEKGIQNMLVPAGRQPRTEDAGTSQHLSQQYFKNLQQNKQSP